MQDRIRGPEHPETLVSHTTLARCLESLGDQQSKAGEKDDAQIRWREGLNHARTAQAAGARVFGKEHPHQARAERQVIDLEAKLKK